MAASPGLRVISLLPSATDTLIAMNLQSFLVGRSHECDAEGTENFPVCTEAKYGLEQGLTAHEVHNAASTAGAAMWEAAFGGLSRMAMLIEWGLSPYRTDPFKLQELQPDVVLTQIQQCGGAVSHEDIEQALHEWVGKSVKIVHLDPKRLSEVWGDIERIGIALRTEEVAQELVSSLNRRMEVVKRAAMGRLKRRVMCVQWAEPLFLAGAWVPEIVRLAGGVDVGHEYDTDLCHHSDLVEKSSCESCRELSTGSGQSETMVDKSQECCPHENPSWDLVKSLKPDALVFAICGCGLEESVKEVNKILQKGELQKFTKGVEVAVVDAARLFSRPGPTLVESLEVLTEFLHPEVQSFGHLGKLWRPFELSTCTS